MKNLAYIFQAGWVFTDSGAPQGSASAAPYRLKFTVYLDDVGDGCNGDNRLAYWTETIDFEVELFVTPKLQTQDTGSKVFGGSRGFKVTNNYASTFNPTIEFDKTISGAKLTHARIGVKAVARLDQKLTVEADAKGTMDETLDLFEPRKFFKVYVTPAGIPVVISGVLRMQLRVEGEVTGALTATETLKIGFNELSYGVEYRNGQFVPFKGAVPVYELRLGGEGKAQANLTVSLLPSLEILAYDALSAKAVLQPYVTAGAGVEGKVSMDTAVDFDTQVLNMAADADYRLTESSLAGGLNAWLYADLVIWDKDIFRWPSDAKKDDYTSFKQIELLPKTTVMDLPELKASVAAPNAAVHPTDACAIKVTATATNLPNPLKSVFPLAKLADSYITWQQWTAPRIIAPLGVPASSYGFVTDAAAAAQGVFWPRFTIPGVYTVRVGGFSSWGTWARQYTEVTVDARDGQTTSGGLRACVKQPKINVDQEKPTVLQSVAFWLSDAYLTIKRVIWNFGEGSNQQTTDVVNGVSSKAIVAYQTTGPKQVTATFEDAVGNKLGVATVNVDVQSNGLDILTTINQVEDQTNTTPVAVSSGGAILDSNPRISGVINSPLPSNMFSVQIFVNNGVEPIGTASVNGKDWHFIPNQPLPEGKIDFKAAVVRADATPGVFSASYSVNLSRPVISGVVQSVFVEQSKGLVNFRGSNIPATGLSLRSNSSIQCEALSMASPTPFTTCTNRPPTIILLPARNVAQCQTISVINSFSSACQFLVPGSRQAIEILHKEQVIGVCELSILANPKAQPGVWSPPVIVPAMGANCRRP